ncbi:hypothetical protein ACMX2H_15925 [Arthrobacter sulfonylureivorans]|uniref:hypothetical protein n=1 Tax=Arthrobacter sulfonylureivorans TaxID=2486855 RepID=UPI0039E43306
MRRLCPACTTRSEHLVSDTCPVCSGAGYLTLGAAALSLYDPEVVAAAARLALEMAARGSDKTLSLSDDRTGTIRATMADLLDAGIVAKPNRPQTPAPRPVTRLPRKRNQLGQYAIERSPEELAAEATGQMPLPLDDVLSSAGCYQYREADRPNARGLPLLSANGHPSHLARVADPMEPGHDTRAGFRHRRATLLRAAALAHSAPEAAAVKRSKAHEQTELMAA